MSLMGHLESKPKQTAVFRGIGEHYRQNMLPKIKAVCLLLEGIVLIHGDDVLKAKFCGRLGPHLQRADDLSTIHSVKDVPPMN